MKKLTWDISWDCNYRCEYCYFSQTGWDNIQKKCARPRNYEEAVLAWKKIYREHGEIRLFLTGGEPFLYPEFERLAAELSKYHILHITTNLSHPVGHLIMNSDPSRIEFNATYHPLKADPEEFTGRILQLKKNKFSCEACFLAHPSQMREMLNYKKYFIDKAIEMAVTEFHGEYLGKNYPQGYTKDELEAIRMTNSYNRFSDDIAGIFHAKGILKGAAVCRDDRRLRENGVNRCKAGVDSAVIGVDGKVRPCGKDENTVLGDIYGCGIEFLPAPRTCEDLSCPFRQDM